LLRLEKRFYRINHANGILETHNVTYGRSMRKLAKPLPLDTPTMIELAPGNSIRVTLIEANHCVGAVMFLIEGGGKAVIYTGDIRAEAWWVNSLVQNPVLIPYTLKRHKLDCIYLDTTFASQDEIYQHFPSKADGIRVLLEKVSDYPNDTVFYFNSWTFGYESVWVALSAFLGARIHVDDYRARIYGSLSNLDKDSLREAGLNVETDNKFLRGSGIDIREAAALCGFRNGNHIQPGCLTSEESARIHSCEHGMGCRVMENGDRSGVVHINPIITRYDGMDIVEAGAGGGKGDLDQKIGLAQFEMADVRKLMETCVKAIRDEESAAQVRDLIQQALDKGNSLTDLSLHLEKEHLKHDDNQPLQQLISAIASLPAPQIDTARPLDRTINFPYSRHSSYSELCSLVSAFNPKDVYPCTVDEATWSPSTSMATLFGAHCSSRIFRHDAEMMPLYSARIARAKREAELNEETQERTEDDDDDDDEGGGGGDNSDSADANDEAPQPQLAACEDTDMGQEQHPPAAPPVPAQQTRDAPSTSHPLPRPPPLTRCSAQDERAPPPRGGKRPRMTNQRIAYEAAKGIDLTWADYGGLECTRRAEDRDEVVL
jgi:hypothetical protein